MAALQRTKRLIYSTWKVGKHCTYRSWIYKLAHAGWFVTELVAPAEGEHSATDVLLHNVLAEFYLWKCSWSVSTLKINAVNSQKNCRYMHVRSCVLAGACQALIDEKWMNEMAQLIRCESSSLYTVSDRCVCVFPERKGRHSHSPQQ